MSTVQSRLERGRAAVRLRAELRRVRRRDFFPSSERDAAVAAVDQLAVGASSDPASAVGRVGRR